MNSTSLQWWMDALRRNVYTQLWVVGVFALLFGASVMTEWISYRKFLVLLGLSGVVFGIASCIGSGLLYDALNKKMHVALAVEKKETPKKHKSKKEDANAERQKTN